MKLSMLQISEFIQDAEVLDTFWPMTTGTHKDLMIGLESLKPEHTAKLHRAIRSMIRMGQAFKDITVEIVPRD